MEESNVIIILGMHRSGTSLTAQWLNECGLFLGGDLLGKGVGNEKGHFESKNILEFHEDILKRHGMNYLTGKSKNVIIDNKDLQRAEEIINKEFKSHDVFGWKEPRTCLFINNVWNKVLPEAKAIIVFRGKKEVINSIIRRQRAWYLEGKWKIGTNYGLKDKLWIVKEKLKLRFGFGINNLVKNVSEAWDEYNKELISYLETKKSSDVLIFSTKDIVERSIDIIQYMNLNWDTKLEKVDISTIYESAMLKQEEDFVGFEEETLFKLKEYQSRSLELISCR